MNAPYELRVGAHKSDVFLEKHRMPKRVWTRRRSLRSGHGGMAPGACGHIMHSPHLLKRGESGSGSLPYCVRLPHMDGFAMTEELPGVRPPEERIRFYRRQAYIARLDAESATGADVQAFLMEASSWDRAAAHLERRMLSDASEKAQ